MNDVELRRPTHRACERCDRREVWAESVGSWCIETVDDERKVGNVYCVHEWDINGTFAPFE